MGISLSKAIVSKTPFIPSVLTPGLVRPLGVYAASRQTFDALVCCDLAPEHALALIFTRLPLEANGWDHGTTKISRIGTHGDGWPIWRLERG